MIGDCQNQLAIQQLLPLQKYRRLTTSYRYTFTEDILKDFTAKEEICSMLPRKQVASLTEPWYKMADRVSMVTLSRSIRTHSWQEGMKEIACAPCESRRGGPSDDDEYELTYFSYLPSNEPSNLQAPFLHHEDDDDDETVIMCSRICNPMQFTRS